GPAVAVPGATRRRSRRRGGRAGAAPAGGWQGRTRLPQAQAWQGPQGRRQDRRQPRRAARRQRARELDLAAQGPGLGRAACRDRGSARPGPGRRGCAPAKLDAVKRTHMCGDLRASDAGAPVVLQGWVNRRRDLGGLIFIDVRDRSGMTQVVIEPEATEAFATATACRSEYVVSITGVVRLRPEGQRNEASASGAVEVLADSVAILSASRTPPFLVDGSVDADDVNEELRLRYRYLDLRRPEALRPLLLRHRAIKAIWDFLDQRGFVQVETPLLTLSTPEGARDFVVPARSEPGSFYA